MPVSREVRAAIGGLVIETTWIEYLVARLVVPAGITDTDNKMSLLALGGKLFELARRATGELKDPEVAARTRLWVDEAEELRRKRHEVVHSIVLHNHAVGWTAYHPKSGSTVAYSTREIVDLARQVCQHADEGNYMSLFDWPPALGLADSVQADENE